MALPEQEASSPLEKAFQVVTVASEEGDSMKRMKEDSAQAQNEAKALAATGSSKAKRKADR